MQPANDTRPGRRLTPPEHAGALGSVLRAEFGTTFRIFQAAQAWAPPTAETLPDGGPTDSGGDGWVPRFGDREQAAVSRSPAGEYRLALSVHDGGRPALVAVGRVAALARSPADEAEETTRLEKWLRAVHERVRAPGGHGPAKAPPAAAAWDALRRLEQLLKTRTPHQDEQVALRRVLESAAVPVGAEAVVYAAAGADHPDAAALPDAAAALLSPRECRRLAEVLAAARETAAAGYLICNDVRAKAWGGRFPNLANLLALPVPERGPAAWVVALNKATPFRRLDASLLAPFAALVGDHARASDGYRQVRDLLVGLTRSLTAAIDAKDSYTCGHSERVARVAVELGRGLNLPEDELSDIYLAGLLHDIGKIGIRDSVLGKRDALNEQEYLHIKDHVKIGYRILSGLRSIAHLLPGVLHHHEQIDGGGYPDGLKGDAIPFLARILSVADSYDAMSTSRPYRAGLPCHRVEQILVEGAGAQWDGAVIDAFLRCKHLVHAVRQRGVGESLYDAVDDALNRGSGRPDRTGSSLNLLGPDRTFSADAPG